MNWRGPAGKGFPGPAAEGRLSPRRPGPVHRLQKFPLHRRGAVLWRKAGRSTDGSGQRIPAGPGGGAQADGVPSRQPRLKTAVDQPPGGGSKIWPFQSKGKFTDPGDLPLLLKRLARRSWTSAKMSSRKKFYLYMESESRLKSYFATICNQAHDLKVLSIAYCKVDNIKVYLSKNTDLFNHSGKWRAAGGAE